MAGKAGGNQSALHQSLVSVIRDYVRARHGFCLKYFAGGLGTLPGAPDFFVAMPIPGTRLAAFVAIEAKTGGAVLNPKQLAVKAEMERAGVLYIVAYDVQQVESALLAAGLVDSPALMCFAEVG